MSIRWKKKIIASAGGSTGGGAGGGVPVGTIVIWSGTTSNIPSGWALCDGQNGTPDLRDRFVLGGGGTNTVGSTGGEETHTLTVYEMPAHNHDFGMFPEPKKVQAGGSTFNASLMMNGQSDNFISETGGSQAHNNMPPYFTLCYIQYIGDTTAPAATV